LPTLLKSPAPRLLCYSRESAIAEKFEAMVKLRELNSRMKDFYDIWLLSRQFDFAGENMAEAIRLTFDRRGTPLSEDIVAFTEGFGEAKQAQWAAFHRRLQQDHVPTSFSEVVLSVREFLRPLTAARTSGEATPVRWSAPGPWE
jgi:hypothetical protein